MKHYVIIVKAGSSCLRSDGQLRQLDKLATNILTIKTGNLDTGRQQMFVRGDFGFAS